MTILPPPITKKTFEKLVSQWIDIIKKNESGSILNLSSREQIWRINQFLQDKKLLKQLNKVQILVVNLAALPIEEAEDFKPYLTKSLNKNKKSVVLLILNACRLLEEKQHLLPYLDSLPHQNSNFSLLYFFQKNILLPHYSKKLSSFSSLYQNICLYPLYKKNDAKQFIEYLQKKYQVNVPTNIQNKILTQCGGHLWFIKEAIRHYIKTKDESTLFNHEEMKLRLQICFNEFDQSEKMVLEKIAQNKTDFTKNETQIIDYLTKTNWLKIPVLEDYIKEQLFHKNKITLNEEQQITINSVLVDNIFSRRERMVLKYFLKNQNQVVSRQKIAANIWGQQFIENYTDWALDQFIKRLRNKIVSLGLDRNIVKTVKNQGFIFQNAYGS